MSIENHPNFFASKFAVEFYSLIENCLRGKGELYKKEVMRCIAGDECWKDYVVDTVEDLETAIEIGIENAENEKKD